MTNAKAVKSPMPSALREYLDALTEPVQLRAMAIIGGGAVRDFYAQTYPRDVDCFVPQSQPADLTEIARALEQAGYKATTVTPRVTTFERNGSPNVQVCMWGYKDIRALIAGFDFTVCQCAVTKDDVWASPFFRTDLNQKVLRLSSCVSPLHTLKRASRFIDAGYRPAPGMLAELAEQIEVLVARTVTGEDVTVEDVRERHRPRDTSHHQDPPELVQVLEYTGAK
jgi:hypothetical protein